MSITPEEILIQLIEECGYTTGVMPPRRGWKRVRAFECSFVGNRLDFVVALNEQSGSVWIGRARSGAEFRANIYEPDSVDKLKAELTGMRDEYHAVHQR